MMYANYIEYGSSRRRGKESPYLAGQRAIQELSGYALAARSQPSCGHPRASEEPVDNWFLGRVGYICPDCYAFLSQTPVKVDPESGNNGGHVVVQIHNYSSTFDLKQVEEELRRHGHR